VQQLIGHSAICGLPALSPFVADHHSVCVEGLLGVLLLISAPLIPIFYDFGGLRCRKILIKNNFVIGQRPSRHFLDSSQTSKHR